MKFTGAVLLWTAFTMIGMKVSSLLKMRVYVLEDTVFFLNTLMSEIEFRKMNIVEILDLLSSETAFKNLSYLKKFSDFDKYGDFRAQWSNAISSFPYYNSDEKEKMLQLGTFLGTTETESQIKTIRIYYGFFGAYRENTVNEYEKYGKLSSLLGLFIGATVFILLI